MPFFMKKKYLFLFFFIVLSYPIGLFAQADSVKSFINFKNYLNKLLVTDSVLSSSQFSICIADLATNSKLIGINESRSMVPASNLKLLTTITALDLLGANYKFETKVFITGNLDAYGVLIGDVIVEGNGDPTLGSDKFKTTWIGNTLTKMIAEKLKDRGVKKIQGNLVVSLPIDDLQPLPNNWTWGDIGNYYGAASTSLNFMDNMFKVTFKPNTEINTLAEVIAIVPRLPDFKITNMVMSGKPNSGDKSCIYTTPYSSSILMQGTVATKNEKETILVKGAHPSPGMQLLHFLRNDLSTMNIATLGIDSIAFFNLKEYSNIKNKTLITSISSPTLAEITNVTNLQSMNLYAEALFKAAGKKLCNTTNYDSTCAAVKKYWSKKGIVVSGMNLYDGSGLSPNNTITTLQFTQLLGYAAKQPWFNYLQSSLPISGESGTLYKLCKGTVAEGKIWAKTGTLSKIAAYTGLVKVTGKQTLVFSIIVNYYEGKPAELTARIEKIFCKMVGLSW